MNDDAFRVLPDAGAQALLEELLNVGFLAGLPMPGYLGLPAANSSSLGRLAIAPAKLKQQMDEGQRPSTDAQAWGHAIHAAILEPDDFQVGYVAAGQCVATLASGRRAGEGCKNDGTILAAEEGNADGPEDCEGRWWCGVHGKSIQPDLSKVVLSPPAYRCCVGLRDNCLTMGAQYAQPRARELLTVPGGEVELTGAWQDEETGEACKLRGDHVADLTACCTDIKSTITEASLDTFSKVIFNRGYYRQQGFYNEGFQALERPMTDHVIIACEKEPPYLVAVFRLLDEVVQAGRKEAQRLLRVYHECMASGVWPGYAPHIIDIGLPPWAKRTLAQADNIERAML